MELILVIRWNPEIGQHCSRHSGEVNAGRYASAGKGGQHDGAFGNGRSD